MVHEINTTTLADELEKRILDFIKDRGLKPGDSMPNEMAFVSMFGVSRNVVREAMSRLRMLGLIQTRTKRGIIISEPPLIKGFQKVADPRFLSIKTIKEMMGMRIVLEIGISEFLFANITDKEIHELEQIVSRQQAIGINNMSVEDELIFHSKIYQIAGNNFIMQFNEIMHPVFVFAKQNYESYFKPISKKLQKVNEMVTHENLLFTIRKKDKDAYQKAIRGHLQPYWEFIHHFS